MSRPRPEIKAKRAAAKAEGLCGICCIRRPSGANKCCDDCIARSYAHRQARGERPAEAFCMECLTANAHRTGCKLRWS